MDDTAGGLLVVLNVTGFIMIGLLVVRTVGESYEGRFVKVDWKG